MEGLPQFVILGVSDSNHVYPLAERETYRSAKQKAEHSIANPHVRFVFVLSISYPEIWTVSILTANGEAYDNAIKIEPEVEKSALEYINAKCDAIGIRHLAFSGGVPGTESIGSRKGDTEGDGSADQQPRPEVDGGDASPLEGGQPYDSVADPDTTEGREDDRGTSSPL